MRSAWFAVPIILALVIAAGCEEDWKRCYAGDYVSCECLSGTFGYAQCNANQTFDACVCNGTTPGLDGGPDTGALGSSGGNVTTFDAGKLLPACTGDAGTVAYDQKCGSNDDCASCICQNFNGITPFCTIPCTTLADCPAPADACTAKGVCHLEK